MAAILYLKASPRGPRSHSSAVADAFLDAYFLAHPQDTLTVKNLFDAELPAYDGFTIRAKYNILHNNQHDPDEARAWGAVERIVAEFKACDKMVMAVPMWNFSLPCRLKHYLDRIVQPGLTFGVDSQGKYTGLVADKPVFIAYASGGEYPSGTAQEGYDFQKPYLEMMLNFMGLTKVRSARAEATLGAASTATARRERAIAQAMEIVKDF